MGDVRREPIESNRTTDPAGEIVTPARALSWAEAGSLVDDNPSEAKRLLVDLSRRLEFIEILADGGKILVNGKPWRDLYDGIQAVVSDPSYPDEERIARSPLPEVTRSYLAAKHRREGAQTGRSTGDG